jgi:raffinose/stachyose/melibiose transport system permease protein
MGRWSFLRFRRAPRGGPRRAPWVLVLPGVCFALAFFGASLVGSVYAFTDWRGVGGAKWIGFANFAEVFSATPTRVAFWNTLKLAGAFFVLVNVLGLSLALTLHRTLRSRDVLRSVFFLPVVVLPIATAYIWQYIFTYNGALNRALDAVGLDAISRPWLGDPGWALWTVLVVLVWHYAGLTMVIYLAGLHSIPQELDEAAAVDGASAWRRFRRITLPLLAPAVTLNAFLATVIGLRAFDQVLALTGGGPVYASETLATQIWKQTFLYGRFGYGAALGLVLAALVMVLTIPQLTVLRARERRI